MNRLASSLAVLLLAALFGGRLVAAAEAEGQQSTVLRLYDTSALSAPTADEPVPAVGLFPLLDRAGAVPSSRESSPGLPPEALAEIVRRAVGDARFEAAGRSVVAVRGGLLVRQTPENHERVRRVLALLESAASRRVEVEILLLELAPGATGKIAAVLSSEERSALLRDAAVKALGSFTASGPFGARLALGTQRETRILADYDVEIAEDASIADPVVELVRDGLSASVRVLPCGGGALDVEATAEIAALDDPIRSLALDAPRLGRVDLPADTCARAAGTAVVPAGGSLALVARGTAGRTGASLAVIVTPRAVGPDLAPLRDAQDGATEARVVELGPALYPPRAFQSLPARGVAWIDRSTLFEGRFSEASDGRVDTNGFEVGEGIPQELGAGQGDDSSFVAPLPGRRALLLGDGDAAQRTASVVDALLEARRGTIEVTLALVTVPAGAERAVDAGALLAAARAEREDGAYFVVPIVPGDRAAVVLGRESAFVSDYDVEVAQKAQIADPQIAFAFTGAAAEVRASRGEDPSRIAVDVRLSLSRSVGPLDARSHGGLDLGLIEFGDVTRSGVERRFTLASGEPAAAIVGRAADGREIALIVVATGA